MKIEIIIPIIVDYLFDQLLDSIEANTVLPDRIILIDNTLNGFYPKDRKIEITRLKSKTGGVNESWNLGIKNVSKDCEAVGIYNDDIVLNPWFFQRTIETLKWDNQCAVACPETIDVTQPLIKSKVRLIRMKRREGWCFTFKKRILDLIPSIPDNLIRTFGGDDFFWRYCYKMGYFWGKDLGNPIWHYKGISVLETGERARKRPEKIAWEQIKITIK